MIVNGLDIGDMPVDDIIRKSESLINRLSILKNFLSKASTLCSGCNKYFITDEADSTNQTVKNYECVYQDCGYGDDDEYAEVTRLVTYKICPMCKTQNPIKSVFISQGPSKRRWE